jgi:hypothetical protein
LIPDLPNDTPLESIEPFYSRHANSLLTYTSSLEGYPFHEEHEYWRKASLERRNAPTDINYLEELNNDIPFDDSGMRGIQVRQPLASGSRENTLIFHLPTTGYEALNSGLQQWMRVRPKPINRLFGNRRRAGMDRDGLENGSPVILETPTSITCWIFHSWRKQITILISGSGSGLMATTCLPMRETGLPSIISAFMVNLPLLPVFRSLPGILGIKVYPNPASDILHIEFGSETGRCRYFACQLRRTVAEKTFYPVDGRGDN